MVMAGASLLVVMTGAMVFGSSDQARRLADSATRLSQAERVLTAAAVTRADLAITVTLIEAGNANLASGESAADALTSTGTAAAAFIHQAEVLDTGSAEIDLATEILLVKRNWETVRDAGEAASVPDLDEQTRTFLASIEHITDQVRVLRGDLARDVAAEGGAAGDFARVASFTVALVAPALALFVYRRLTRGRIDRLRREEALRRREEVASAKESLIAGLSHELRTPLTAITGFAAAMMETLHGPSGDQDRALLQELSGTVHSQSNELSRMVEDLLATMRLGDGLMSTRPTVISAEKAVENVLEGFGDEGRAVQVEMDDGHVSADPLQLKHVMRNLISNAIRHGDGRRMVVGMEVEGAYRISVVDHGDGIAEGIDPDASFAHGGHTPLITGSIGIGLSVAYNLAALMGTEMHYAREGDMTVFWFDLPIAQPKTVADIAGERRDLASVA